MEREVYTVDDVAVVCNVTPETVRRWIRTDMLKATLHSRKEGYVIYKADLQIFKEQSIGSKKQDIPRIETEYMHTVDAQKILGASQSTINNMIHDGRLKAKKLNPEWASSRWLIETKSVYNYLEHGNRSYFTKSERAFEDSRQPFPKALSDYLDGDFYKYFTTKGQAARAIIKNTDIKMGQTTIANNLTSRFARKSMIKFFEDFFSNYGYTPDAVIDNSEGEEKIILKTIKEKMTIEEMTEAMNEEDLYHFVHNLNSSQLAYFNCLLNIPFFYNQEKKKYGDS